MTYASLVNKIMNVGSTARKIFFTFLKGAKFKDRSYTSQINQEMILNSILGSSSLFRDESFNYLLRARPRVQAFVESMVNVF